MLLTVSFMSMPNSMIDRPDKVRKYKFMLLMYLVCFCVTFEYSLARRTAVLLADNAQQTNHCGCEKLCSRPFTN